MLFINKKKKDFETLLYSFIFKNTFFKKDHFKNIKSKVEIHPVTELVQRKAGVSCQGS